MEGFLKDGNLKAHAAFVFEACEAGKQKIIIQSKSNFLMDYQGTMKNVRQRMNDKTTKKTRRKDELKLCCISVPFK